MFRLRFVEASAVDEIQLSSPFRRALKFRRVCTAWPKTIVCVASNFNIAKLSRVSSFVF